MQLEMCHVTGHENQIEGAFSADLVGDVDVATLGVLDLGDIHWDSVPLRSPSVQYPEHSPPMPAPAASAATARFETKRREIIMAAERPDLPASRRRRESNPRNVPTTREDDA
jgi:hypothetical protein